MILLHKVKFLINLTSNYTALQSYHIFFFHFYLYNMLKLFSVKILKCSYAYSFDSVNFTRSILQNSRNWWNKQKFTQLQSFFLFPKTRIDTFIPNFISLRHPCTKSIKFSWNSNLTTRILISIQIIVLTRTVFRVTNIE